MRYRVVATAIDRNGKIWTADMGAHDVEQSMLIAQRTYDELKQYDEITGHSFFISWKVERLPA
jgi:hypothetical protein